VPDGTCSDRKRTQQQEQERAQSADVNTEKYAV
jgi:hypothetical protein